MSATTDDELLERILTLDTLRWAWRRVRENKGSAGPDGVTIRRFERLLESNLLDLADEVRGGAYQPGRPRRVTVPIGGKPRTLSIFPVRDRILQRATLDILSPRVDRHFLRCSFGYRPGRSLQDSVERVVHLRDRGLVWVVDADIRRCFESLDHHLLREYLEPLVPDARVRGLLGSWMAVGRPRK